MNPRMPSKQGLYDPSFEHDACGVGFVVDMAGRRSRAIVRQALERYLEDFDDLAVTIERLRDPSDPVLDWDQVRRELLDSD